MPKDHYVPQFYLRRFANNKGQVRAYRHSTQQWLSTTANVKNLDAESDFYTLSTQTGDSRDVEKWLGDVEAKAQRVLARGELFANTSSPVGRAKIAYHIALQYLRTPAARTLFDDLARDTIVDYFHQNFVIATPKHLSQLYEKIHGRAPLDNEVERFRRAGMLLAQSALPPPSANNHMRVMGEKALILAGILAERQWRILIWRDEALLTSDTPVVLYSAERGYRAGFANADHILFPLDPRACLSIDATAYGPNKELVHVPGSTAAARFVNMSMFYNSIEWVFATPRMNTPLMGITF